MLWVVKRDVAEGDEGDQADGKAQEVQQQMSGKEGCEQGQEEASPSLLSKVTLLLLPISLG